MSILLPISGISVSLPVLVGIGLIVGFLSGMVGVGGGFLLTPLLMLMGVPPPIAAASGTNIVVATSASGVGAHFRFKHVDFRLGAILVLGGLTGGAVGDCALDLLASRGGAGLMITITYVLVLGTIGIYMLLKSWGHFLTRRADIPTSKPESFDRRLPFQIYFPHSGVRHSALSPFFVATAVGVLAAMGMGGGFALVPVLVYLLRVPEHVAVGTSLFEILLTCSAVTIMDTTTTHSVDIILVLLVAVGSTVGAQLGARASVHLRGSQLMVPLALMVLAVAGEMLLRLLRTPSNLLQLTLISSHLRG